MAKNKDKKGRRDGKKPPKVSPKIRKAALKVPPSEIVKSAS